MLSTLLLCVFFVFTRSEDEFRCNAPAECALECIRSHNYLLRKLEREVSTMEAKFDDHNVTMAAMNSAVNEVKGTISDQASSKTQLEVTINDLEDTVLSLLTNMEEKEEQINLLKRTVETQGQILQELTDVLENIQTAETYSWEDHSKYLTSANWASAISHNDGYHCLKLRSEVKEYFRVLYVGGEYTGIAVVAAQHDTLTHFCAEQSFGFALYEGLGMYNGGHLAVSPSTQIVAGDICTVRIDRDTNTISWELERGGVDLGVVFEFVETAELPDVLHPAVRLCRVGAAVELLEIDGIVIPTGE